MASGDGNATYLASVAAAFAADLDELERIVVFRVVGSGERSR